MKKNLFILLFLICVMPVFVSAEEETKAQTDEFAPVEMNINADNTVKERKHFKLFKREKSKELQDKKLAEKEAKKLKKEQKKSEKLAKKTKRVKNNAEIENQTEEIPVVNTNSENPILTDIAYHGGINTSKIIQVDECVKIALENHPAIISAMSNADIYKSRIAQAWSNYFPTFSAGLNYSKNDMLVTTFAPAVQRYDLFYVPTVSANMLLFDFGKTKSEADIAKKSFESAKYSLENTVNTVIYNVRQSYYNLLFALQQVKVYEDTVHDYEMHLEQAKAYYDIGKKPKIDVLTAEYNLGKAKLNLIQAKNTLKIAYVELSNAMGMPDFSDYDVVDNLSTKTYEITVEEAVNKAYETSPELLSAKKRADASEVLVRASKRAFAPDLSGFASYSKGGKKIDTDDSYQIGVQLNYQNVNLLQLKKQVDEAKATYKKDFADYQNTKQNIYFEVKQAYLNMVTAQESIIVSKLSMNQAKEQYDLASGRYKVGMGDAIELKDAETTYRNSQLDYYNTLLNYHVSAANLERLMGTPLEKSDVDLL